ncbi:PaaX family transcriptional regulator C-terminal domain-containing protein [Streptomyces virginiae]|uniref:PaaX family transcriptional regulator C-terminal domain-containing protein n=1 Tax=Streptomyces virginiae TaxID=1961 RepID=UPI0036B59B85
MSKAVRGFGDEAGSKAGVQASPLGATVVKTPEIPTRLLVEALVREDGRVDAGELYAVATAMGMTDQQVRLCIKRLVAEGRFSHEGRGRKAVLRAVADASGALAPDADFVRFAYLQDRGQAPWDGRWHLTAFAVPESRRPARDALRDRLLALGAAPLQGGLYVTANDIGAYLTPAAAELGVASAITTLTSSDLCVGGTSDPKELAASLWPLEEIAARYQDLAALATDRLARVEAALGAAAEPAVGLSAVQRLTYAVEAAAEFTRAMTPDPLLPPELLPADWTGTRARALAARLWHRLAELPAGPNEPRLFRLYAQAPSTGHAANP